MDHKECGLPNYFAKLTLSTMRPKDVHWKPFMRMFIADSFVIAKTWKQPKCLSTREWINSLLHNDFKSTNYWYTQQQRIISLLIWWIEEGKYGVETKWLDLHDPEQGKLLCGDGTTAVAWVAEAVALTQRELSGQRKRSVSQHRWQLHVKIYPVSCKLCLSNYF